MLTLEVNSREFKAFETWDEMPLRDGFRLVKTVGYMPDKLRELYLATLEEGGPDLEKNERYKEAVESITDQDEEEIFPEFYAKVVGCVTDIPEEIISKTRKTGPESLSSYYAVSGQKFVFALMFNAYEAKKPKSLTLKLQAKDAEGELVGFEDLEVYFPDSRQVLEEVRPMAYEDTIVLTEALDLLDFGRASTEGVFAFGRELISVIARPEGEKYSEEVSLDRAERMDFVTMDVAFEVLKYVEELNFWIFQKYDNLTKKPRSGKNSDYLSSYSGFDQFGWRGHVLEMAGTPNRIEQIERSNCHNFLDLISYKHAGALYADERDRLDNLNRK